jgi:hypothetical protein
MITLRTPGSTFRVEHDAVEVTSTRRTDTGWRYTDRAGHVHQWYAQGQPARSYSPTGRYELSTLSWLVIGQEYDEDGEPYDVGMYVCRTCGEGPITPGYTADYSRQYVAGLSHYYIDDQPVERAEFERRLAEWRASQKKKR